MRKKLQQIFGKTLRRQWMLGIVLVVVPLMTVFVWNLMSQQRSLAIEQQSDRAIAMARSVAAANASWVVSRDFSGLQEAVDGLSSFPDLSHALVLDTRGEVLAHTDPEKRRLYLKDMPAAFETVVFQRGIEMVDVAVPVFMENRAVGWVRVGMAGTLLQNRLSEIKKVGTYYTLFALAMGMAFAFFASRYLTRRLHAITQVTYAVRSGNEKIRVNVQGSDEAADLSAQVNSMLDSLEQRGQAIRESEVFKNAILDSVAAEIAVINAQGVIVAVNANWRRFALENSDVPGQPARNTAVGANYLEQCANSAAAGDADAAKVLAGIEAVLAGTLASFSADYPCHSPDKLRYFSMVVHPLGVAEHRGAAITHTDITDAKQAVHFEVFRRGVLELLEKNGEVSELLGAIEAGVQGLLPGVVCRIRMHAGESHVVPRDAASGLLNMGAAPIRSSSGKLFGTLALYRRTPYVLSEHDATLIEHTVRLIGIAIEHKATQTDLRESEETFRNLFETSPNGVVYQNTDGNITAANPAATRILGLTLDQLQGRTSMHPDWKMVGPEGISIPGEQHPSMRVLRSGEPILNETVGVSRPDGSYVWLVVSAMPVFRSGKLVQVYAIFEDVTERHLLQEQLRQLAFFDPLTRLPNRRLLTDRLSQALVGSKRSNNFGAMLFLDLDNFKPLNDSHGHDVGDLLLVEVARRLKSSVREMDTVARFGGDEFVVMLADLTEIAERAEAEALGIAEKIRALLAMPYTLEVHRAQGVITVEHHCTASIGLTLFDHRDSDLELILMRADASMYQAKERGRNRVCVTLIPAAVATASPARRLLE